MKKIILILCLGLCLFANGIANAGMFYDIVDWDIITIMGRDCRLLSGLGSPYTFTYNHDVDFIPDAVEVTYATLTLSHFRNSDSKCELWAIYGDDPNGNAVLIDQLAYSNSGWLDQSFILPPELYESVSGGSWTLAITLQESTGWLDFLWIDKSELSGTYTPVPIPGAIWLLGFGLIGIAGIKRKLNK